MQKEKGKGSSDVLTISNRAGFVYIIIIIVIVIASIDFHYR
jgi:hypothetical protein